MINALLHRCYRMYLYRRNSRSKTIKNLVLPAITCIARKLCRKSNRSTIQNNMMSWQNITLIALYFTLQSGQFELWLRNSTWRVLNETSNQEMNNILPLIWNYTLILLITIMKKNGSIFFTPSANYLNVSVPQSQSTHFIQTPTFPSVYPGRALYQHSTPF